MLIVEYPRFQPFLNMLAQDDSGRQPCHRGTAALMDLATVCTTEVKLTEAGIQCGPINKRWQADFGIGYPSYRSRPKAHLNAAMIFLSH